MKLSEFLGGKKQRNVTTTTADPFEFSAKTLAALEARRNTLVESGWSRTLTDELRNLPMIGLDPWGPGTPTVSRHLIRTAAGNFFVLWWDGAHAIYTWAPVTEDHAREEAYKVVNVYGTELLKKFFAGTWNPPSPPRFYA